jgi:hypothetical protein
MNHHGAPARPGPSGFVTRPQLANKGTGGLTRIGILVAL